MSHIINCANNALVDDNSFQVSMEELVKTLRNIFKSEYCAIGIVSNNIVEDYACDYNKHIDETLLCTQVNNINKTRKVKITNNEYFVCKALNDKTRSIIRYDEEDIKSNNNNHFELYQKILKSEKISNTTIISLRDVKLENFGYIQFINSEKYISLDDIEQFQDGLLKLVQMIIKEEEDKCKIEENRKFISDSNFIKELIQQKHNVDELLDNVMNYLSKEFNAAVISFRIPVLNGKEKVPLFYIRRCYVSNKISYGEQIKKHYYNFRIIKNKDELGGYDKLKCCNNGNIFFEQSMDSDYYDKYDLDLDNQAIILPVLKNIGKNECIRVKNSPLCDLHENKDCVERFEKLYGLFKLRLFKNDIQDSDVAQLEEKHLKDETKKRLLYLSGQITLILNSIVDKNENESLKIFRKSLKSQNFLKVRDFDKQFVEVIKKSTHAKECSIYRYRKNDDFSEQIILSATTSKHVLIDNKQYEIDKVYHKLNYSISDETNIVVRVFKNKIAKYFYCLESSMKEATFIELINNTNSSVLNESAFFAPIIKKDEEETCLGVVVLFGKQKAINTISDYYWEQDKGLIEFIVEMFTRISEADNERLTFLGQLGHELLSPITELIHRNDLLINRYEIRKEPIDKKRMLLQMKSNINNCLLFKHIITDIEHIYSSSIKDTVYNIELQDNPKKLLFETVNLFETICPIIPSVKEMPPLYLDKYKIKQVFINILKNAIQYSYMGQPIEIYYKSPEENTTRQHEIKFVNYGIGILEEDKNRIFELYKRGKNAAERKASGSGMGLYIVKEIMKAHGGDCIIRSFKNPTEISLLFPKNYHKNN